ncbi:MAG: hypothetical protein ABI418_01685 [Jatrophihabitantaceae bacterium]
MSQNHDTNANQPPADAVRISRPPSVDRAIYALLARCVLSIGAALALYGARPEVRDSLAKTDAAKNWSAATLDQHVTSNLRSNVLAMVVYSLMVLVLIKYIREGRGWARWLYLVFAFLIPGDVLQVLGFAAGKDLLLRLVSGLYGLSAIIAVVLLFLPSSATYFRRPGTIPLAASLFRPRAATQRRTPTPADAAGEPVAATAVGPSEDAAPADPAPASRKPPRAKSRKRADQ